MITRVLSDVITMFRDSCFSSLFARGIAILTIYLVNYVLFCFIKKRSLYILIKKNKKKLSLFRLKYRSSRSLIMSLNLYEISETNEIVNPDFLTIFSSEVSFVFYFKVLLLNNDFRRSLIVLKIKSIG